MSKIAFPIKTVDELASLLKIEVSDLWRIAKTTRKLYSCWEVSKPAGGKRQLSTPTKELKSIQRKLHRLVFSKLDFGPCSHYGLKKKSGITNAREHLGNKLLFSCDLKSFFPSVRPQKVYCALVDEFGCPEPLASLITKLTTVNHQLPQGAPTSTDIANIVTMRLQRRLYSLAKHWGLKKFTIYADDINISGDLIPEGLAEWVKKIVREEGFKIHRKKGGVFNKSKSQIVTGVNIAHVGSVGKRMKNWRAEHHKNMIKFRNGEISKDEFESSQKRYIGRKVHAVSVKKIANQRGMLSTLSTT